MHHFPLKNRGQNNGESRKAKPDKKKEIAGAVIDSRQVESGYLFIAVKGEKVDGHQFIPQVFEKGALAVLSEQELSEPAGPYIRVESTLGAMKKLAAYLSLIHI